MKQLILTVVVLPVAITSGEAELTETKTVFGDGFERGSMVTL